ADLDISEAPGDLEEQDAVDDNRNGKLDAGETDNKPATPGKTVTVILKNGKIPKEGVIELAIRFDKDLPTNSAFVVYFSKEINGVHYELAADTTGLDHPGTTAVQPVGPGVVRTALMLVNTTGDYLTDLSLVSPLPSGGLAVGPPFDSSLVLQAGPGTYTLQLIPPLPPGDFVDLGVDFVSETDSSTAPFSIQTTGSQPFDCGLAASGFTGLPCDPFGNYQLTIDSLTYNTAPWSWQEYEFVNTTDKNVSDLEVVFAGTGGSLTVQLLKNPEGCPQPQIPSNGKVTNVMKVVWPAACIEPGKSVQVKVGTLNGPLAIAGGAWTINGQKEADLDLDSGVLEGRGSGTPDGKMNVFFDGVWAGDYRPDGSGLDTVLLTALPANAALGVDVTIVWDGRQGCSDTIPDAFDAPDCLNTGYFAVQQVEQFSYLDPVVQALSDDGELTFRYFNPPTADPRYLNMLYLPLQASEPVWLAENILLEPFADTVQLITRVDFDPDNMLDPAVFDQVRLQVLITDTIFTAVPEPGEYTLYPVDVAVYSIGDFIEDSTLLEPVFPLQISEPLVDDEVLWVAETPVYADLRTDMPNIDLDNSKYKAGSKNVPDGYAGDRKACAPAGTTNSFSWLRKHHPAIDDSLKKAFGTGDEADIMRKILYEFSALMKRKPNMGASPDNIIKAKLEFVDKYKLPVRVKFQSVNIDTSIKSPDKRYGHEAINKNQPTTPQNPQAKISLDWIKSEFDKGEDVELGIYRVKYDASNKRYVLSGHLVTLTDIDKANKRWTIKFRDDRNQRNRGGLRKDRRTSAREFKGNPAAFRGMIRLPNLDNSNGKAFLGSVFSESFDSTITFAALNIKSADITPASCVHSPDGSIALVLEGGVPPYTVTWNNGAEGPVVMDLMTGEYTCTVTDAAGNTLEETFFVPAPPPMVIEVVSLVSPYCPSDPTGSIEVIVQGGTPPYLVNWGNDNIGPILTEVPAGDYTVVVTDAGGCMEIATITLPAADDIAPIVSATDASLLLDAGSTVVLTPAMFQVTAVDNCGPVTILLEPGMLDCSDLGTTPVTLTAVDLSGNSTSVVVNATLADVLPPVAVTIPNIAVALDPVGQVVISPELIDAGSTDNCTVNALAVDMPVFDCSSVG
ncbi:MAG: hypothetical protein EP344_02255, partial [Bacteroidetes bacterium]